MIYYFTLKTLVHECGHLVFGLLTGYKFETLRIRHIMLMKAKDHYKITKHYSYGSLGQCVMAPLEYREGKNPYVLYMLGGIIFDTLFAVIFTLIGITPSVLSNPVRIVFLSLAFTDFINVFTNGVVSRKGKINNDGTNTYYLAKDQQSIKCFYMNSKVFYYLLNGKTYKDLPEDIYRIPVGASLASAQTGWQIINHSYYYMDLRLWENALACLTELEAVSGKQSKHMQINLLMEKLFLYIKLNRSTSEIENLYDQVKKDIKYFKYDFNMVRVRMTYELYKDGSIKRKMKINDELETEVRKYPFEGEAIFCANLVREMIN
ncbi:MAG TPA: hypothetical protein VN258_06250 [Mobilitalea sp.]|nr:hypothetical protein [Mobilitalea sp.]